MTPSKAHHAAHTPHGPHAPAAPAPVNRRAYGLDALRGIAILMMVLSGTIPAAFPAWMHHAQVPPPDFKFNAGIPGITWVDLVFPFFLFAMGAAIPLALSRRIAKGEPWWRLGLTAVQRFLLLGLFAVYVGHIGPEAMYNDPSVVNCLTPLFGFALLFMMLMRLPERWHTATKIAIRAGGAVGAFALLLPFSRAHGWEAMAGQNDIIIRILANVVLGTSLAWMATRKNWTMRLGILGLLMAVRLAAAGGSSWVASVWDYVPPHAGWLYSAGMLFYLFISIPGTIVGDMLLEWMRGPASAKPGWTGERFAMAGLVGFAFTPVCLWGLFTRHPATTFLLCAALALYLVWLVERPATATERLIRSLSTWGIFWLALGLLFEPYENGIHKDPATMSYYFVTAGLACTLVSAFTVLIDVFNRRRAVSILIDNGQNPMIAYVSLGLLVQPILFLTRINPAINDFIAAQSKGSQAWWSFAHGAAATLLVALAVSGFTRAKVFWRT